MTLNEIAKKMCAKGKGILAADESTGTIAKRFKSINVENLEKNRLNFRQTLFNSSAMKDYIGGVILFDHNYEHVEQVKSLIDSIKSINNDIFIAVDHEGGRVQRFKEDFTLLPSFESIGDIYLDDQDLADEIAYYCGYISGFELKRAGIDINFSPVVDLSSDSNVLNSRTLSRDPEVILRLASRYIMGHIDNEIIPVLKHFPGHGAVLSDTHTTVSYTHLTLPTKRIV